LALELGVVEAASQDLVVVPVVLPVASVGPVPVELVVALSDPYL
jgi:hypothetical protein